MEKRNFVEIRLTKEPFKNICGFAINFSIAVFAEKYLGKWFFPDFLAIGKLSLVPIFFSFHVPIRIGLNFNGF